MGELIKKAREEAGISQEELAKQIYRKRLAVSEMENGKVEINAWVLPHLANALNKPIAYFFPSWLTRELKQEDITTLEQELLIHFRNIWDENLQKVSIQQVKTLADFDPEKTILDALIAAKSKLEAKEKIKEIINNRPNYQKVINSILELLAKLSNS